MPTQKFRLSLKAILWECSVILLAVPALGLAFMMGVILPKAIGNIEIEVLRFMLSAYFSFLAFVLLALSIWIVLVPIGRAIFSYLTLSEKGLEYRLWPLHRIRCAWEDVGQIKKSALSFQGEILTLQNAEVSGFHLFLNLITGKRGVIRTIPVIPLYQIDGWSSGKLKIELRKYAPKLFTEQIG